MKRWIAWAVLILVLSPVRAQPTPGASPVAAALQPFVDKHQLAGAVTLIADRDKVLSRDTVGYADIAANAPMKVDSLFWIASMSKPITAATVMILVDEGKLSLDDPIEKHLPEFKGLWVAVEKDKDHILLKRPARRVTLRDILCHTSGMPFRSALEEPTLDRVALNDAARSYAITPLDSQPGTKYQYSNAGINTAGRIVEVVSKMPFETFLTTRLLAPLGMTDTTFWPTEEQVKRLAKSYKPDAAKTGLEETKITMLSYPLTGKARQPMPGGGLFSTADDVAKFGRFLLNDGVHEGKRLLSVEAVHEMTKKQMPEAITQGYGLGLSTGGGGYGHGGAYATNLQVDAKRGLVMVYLVQHSGFPGDGAKALGAFRSVAERKFGEAVK